MTNKEFFKTLDKNIQMDIIQTLRSYNKVHIEFYYGEYHVTTNYTLMAKYPSDYKMLNEFKAKEFDFEGHKMPLPAGYHEYLTLIFGDYMKRPPAPERVAKHELLFVDMDHPYTDYKGIYYFPDKKKDQEFNC